MSQKVSHPYRTGDEYRTTEVQGQGLVSKRVTIVHHNSTVQVKIHISLHEPAFLFKDMIVCVQVLLYIYAQRIIRHYILY